MIAVRGITSLCRPISAHHANHVTECELPFTSFREGWNGCWNSEGGKVSETRKKSIAEVGRGRGKVKLIISAEPDKQCSECKRRGQACLKREEGK